MFPRRILIESNRAYGSDPEPTDAGAFRKREKYGPAALHRALHFIESNPGYGLALWNTGGLLAEVEPRVEAVSSSSGLPACGMFLNVVPNLPPALLQAGLQDDSIGKWLVALSFQSSLFRGEFLLREIEDGLVLEFDPIKARSALAAFQTGARHFHYWAEWLASADQAGKTGDKLGKRWLAFSGMLAKALKMAPKSVAEIQRAYDAVEKYNNDLRRAHGARGPRRRAWQSIRRVAFYLWLRLRVHHGWSRRQAADALNQFLRVRRCGFAVPPPPEAGGCGLSWSIRVRRGATSMVEDMRRVLAKKDPPRPRHVHIWSPSRWKGNDKQATPEHFEQIMYHEMKRVLVWAY